MIDDDYTIEQKKERDAQIRSRVLCEILNERDRQDAKWGEQNHDPITYVTILMEEVGEFAQAALETRFGGPHGGTMNMLTEAIHIAAVSIAILESLHREIWVWRSK